MNRGFNGLLWNSLEKVTYQITSLASNMILARLLMPTDFGLIALMSVFINMTDTIVMGGYRQTLIIKSHLKEVDVSTSFVYNMAMSLALYCVMAFTAPYIAVFYREPKLISLIRVLGLVNVLNAGYFVQDSLMQRDMMFKALAIRSILSSAVSGIIGVLFAMLGFGVWSLVFMTLSRSIVINIYLWLQRIWRFNLNFSWLSFKKDFSFGSRLMLTQITGVFLNNINSLIIGKFYNKADLGYYYQADKLKRIPTESAVGVISKTYIPLLSCNKENIGDLNSVYRQSIKMAAAVIIPLIVLLILVGGDLITLLFSDKWLKSIPMFNILVFGSMFAPFIVINGTSPAIMGDSKAYLRIDTVYKAMLLVAISVAVPFGLKALIITQAAFSLIQMTGNAFVARRYFRVSLRSQLSLYAPFFLYAGISAIGVVLINVFSTLPLVLNLVVKALAFIFIFSIVVRFIDPSLFLTMKKATLHFLHKLIRRS